MFYNDSLIYFILFIYFLGQLEVLSDCWNEQANLGMSSLLAYKLKLFSYVSVYLEPLSFFTY